MGVFVKEFLPGCSEVVSLKPVGDVIPFWFIVSDDGVVRSELFFCFIERNAVFMCIDSWESLEPNMVGIGTGH